VGIQDAGSLLSAEEVSFFVRLDDTLSICGIYMLKHACVAICGAASARMHVSVRHFRRDLRSNNGCCNWSESSARYNPVSCE
jgi:hypothetical protein